jgi:DNA-binding NtrC family response regulator
VPILAQHFLRELAGSSAPTLLPEAIASLQAYDWPGNVRELRNLMERLVLTRAGAEREIGPEALHLRSDRLPRRTQVGADVTVSELERQHIVAVLERAAWHQGRAAAMLGISASTLYRKMRDLGVDKPAKRRPRARGGRSDGRGGGDGQPAA